MKYNNKLRLELLVEDVDSRLRDEDRAKVPFKLFDDEDRSLGWIALADAFGCLLSGVFSQGLDGKRKSINPPWIAHRCLAS